MKRVLEFQSTATREAAGTASFRSWSALPLSSALSSETPVMFPPGRARLGTIPVPTGSPTAPRTIGMVWVACFAAMHALGGDRDDDVRPAADQLGGQCGQPVGLASRGTEVDDEVLAFDVAQLGQPLLQGARRSPERGMAPVSTAIRQTLAGAWASGEGPIRSTNARRELTARRAARHGGDCGPSDTCGRRSASLGSAGHTVAREAREGVGVMRKTVHSSIDLAPSLK